MSFNITIDATDVKEYQGKPTDFFLCHTPLLKDSSDREVEYVLQNEWPFVMLQVLKFPDHAAAMKFASSAPGNESSSLIVENVVLRLEGCLANVNRPHTELSPEEVVDHVDSIMPKAGHWYKLVVLNTKK